MQLSLLFPNVIYRATARHRMRLTMTTKTKPNGYYIICLNNNDHTLKIG